VKIVQEARPDHADLARDAEAMGEWLRDLDALRASIQHGLAHLVAAKLATVVVRAFSVTECAFGTYSTLGLEITLVVLGEPRLIFVRPRGLSILGAVETGVARALSARGRVDIQCGLAKVIVLRFPDSKPTRWVSFSGGERRALDEKGLLNLLVRVTELRPK
jgi:hypothetical protein